METYDKNSNSVEDEFASAQPQYETEELPTANIMVAGITGTGKSTLLNAIFESEVAATGKGRPITAQIDEYHSEDVPIHIWDTVGLELDSEKTKESISAIRKTIADKAESKDQFDRVHAIWYCINSGSSRYQGAELEFIKNLHSIGVPFIIVLTQCIGDPEEIDAFEAQIRTINESMGMNDIDIVQVCAKDFKLRGFTVEAFGLDVLVDTTLKKLPDFIKGGFIAAQKVSQAHKRILSEDIIFQYIDLAQRGFWDKIPIINVFTTDAKTHKMFRQIGKIYNTVLSDDDITEIMEEIDQANFKNQFWGLICPVSKKYDQKLDHLFSEKKAAGYNVHALNLEKSERVARLVAYCAYIFLDAVEEVWQDVLAGQIQKAQARIDHLKQILKRKFNK